MLERYLVTPVQLVKTTRDVHGDLVYANSADTIYCRILDHIEIMTNDRKEQVQTDAIAWFGATAGVEMGDVLKDGDSWYRVAKLVKAKRGGENQVLFIKGFLMSSNPIKGVS